MATKQPNDEVAKMPEELGDAKPPDWQANYLMGVDKGSEAGDEHREHLVQVDQEAEERGEVAEAIKPVEAIGPLLRMVATEVGEIIYTVHARADAIECMTHYPGDRKVSVFPTGVDEAWIVQAKETDFIREWQKALAWDTKPKPLRIVESEEALDDTLAAGIQQALSGDLDTLLLSPHAGIARIWEDGKVIWEADD